MSALAHGFASARIRASRGLALIVFIIAFSHGSFAASQLCEEKTITRTETVALTRDSREARVALDVLVSRDDVVAASLSAKARGNFGGSDAAAKWAEVTTSVTTSGGANLRCEGGEASQCSAWYDCGDSSDATAAVVDGVILAAVTIPDAVEFDYCEKGGLAEVEVSVDFTGGARTHTCAHAAGRRLRRVRKKVVSAGAFELTCGRRPRSRDFPWVLLLRARAPRPRSMSTRS